MSNTNDSLHLAKLLASRLERLSADSVYAHRASGIRGTLLRFLGQGEKDGADSRLNLGRLIENGFAILEMAAKEKANNMTRDSKP